MDLIDPVCVSGEVVLSVQRHRGSKFGGLATLLEWMQEMNCVWVGLRSSPYGWPCIDEQPAMQGRVFDIRPIPRGTADLLRGVALM